MDFSSGPSLLGEYKFLSIGSPSVAMQIDPEQKIIGEIYEALLPVIVESWEEISEPKKMNYVNTASSDITLNEADPSRKACIKFKNQNSYSGDVQKKRLHGQGIFRWSDGSTYEGYFHDNVMDGEGKIAYSSGARYTGQVSYGYHHGHGLFISNQLKYGGNFDGGQFHGSGNLEAQNAIYSGKFDRNRISEGVRTYKDGVFSGTFDIFGERAKGRFLLNNGDIYNGSWHEDHFCDFGIYRWDPVDRNGIRNRFIILQENYYIGYWADSHRFGVGVLHFDDKVIYSNWKFDLEVGPGVVIAANGEVFVDEYMLSDGSNHQGFKVIQSKEADQCIQQLENMMQKTLKANDSDSRPSEEMVRKQHACGVIEWNMSHVCETMLRDKVKELMQYAEKMPHPCSPLFLPKYSIDVKSTPIIDFVSNILTDVDREVLEHLEIKSINQVILSNFTRLEEIYRKYAQYGLVISKDRPIFLIRLGLWRFFKTICSFNPNVNVVECIDEAEYTFHLLSKDLNDPDEIIYFWQFLKYILYLTMLMNRNYTIADQAMTERPKYFGLFGTMLLIFLREQESIQPLPYDNLPKLILADINLTIYIFDYIRRNFGQCSLRKAYAMYKDFCEKSRLTNEGATYLTFEDFILCVSKEYPSAVRNNILIHIDVRLTPLEMFEIFILLVNTQLRNEKYSIEKTKFLKMLAAKHKEKEAEDEEALAKFESADKLKKPKRKSRK